MFQALQTGLPERRRQDGDQLVGLAVVVRDQRLEYPIGRRCSVILCLHGDLAISPHAARKTPITAPLLSSHRSSTAGARAMNRQSRSRASVGSALATVSTIARRWISRSSARALTPRQSTNARDRATAASRLRTSLASSPGLRALANANLSRRLAAALPILMSISNSADRPRRELRGFSH